MTVRRHRSRRGLTLGAVLALTVAACSSDDQTSGEQPSDITSASTTGALPAATDAPTTAAPTTTSAPASTTPSTIPSTTQSPAATLRAGRPYEVETVTFTFVDDSRPTTAVTGEPLPSRTLPTTVWRPITDDVVPLIVFSHGFGASPAKFERMLGAWAGAGYAVAAPTFPLTNDTIDPAERDLGDVVNQAGDVSFVLDQVLASDIGSTIDTSRLAAAGLSLGGLTTYIAAIDESTRDDRFVAAVVQAAVPPGPSFVAHEMPVLVMHGELDPVVPLATAESASALLAAPVYTVTLLGGFHAEPFEDAEDNTAFPDRETFHPIVDATSIAFWDTHLAADPSAAAEISDAADQPGISTIASRT